MKAQKDITIIAPLALHNTNIHKIEEIKKSVRNEHKKINKINDKLHPQVHFCSASIICIDEDYFCVLELSIDGSRKQFLKTMTNNDEWLHIVDTIFKHCKNYPEDTEKINIAKFLEKNSKKSLLFSIGIKYKTIEMVKSEHYVFSEIKQKISGLYQQCASRNELWDTLISKYTHKDSPHSYTINKANKKSFTQKLNIFKEEKIRLLKDRFKYLLKLFVIAAGLYLIINHYSKIDITNALWIKSAYIITAIYLVFSLLISWEEIPKNIRQPFYGKALLNIFIWRSYESVKLLTSLVVLVWLSSLGLMTLTAYIFEAISIGLLSLQFIAILFIGFLLAGKSGLFYATIAQIILFLSILNHYHPFGENQNHHYFFWMKLDKPLPLFTLSILLIVFEITIILILILYSTYKIRKRELIDIRQEADQSQDTPYSEENPVHQPSIDFSRGVQEHMVSVTKIKSGKFSLLLLKFLLRAIHFYYRYIKDKKVGEGPSIRFARYIIMEHHGCHYLLFFSNYDGDWFTYLGEFRNSSLNLTWGNTRGFPQTFFLLGGGSYYEQKFKRYANASRFETLLWCSAYPTIHLNESIMAADMCKALNYPPQRQLFDSYSLKWPKKTYLDYKELDRIIRLASPNLLKKDF